MINEEEKNIYRDVDKDLWVCRVLSDIVVIIKCRMNIETDEIIELIQKSKIFYYL